jgi:hypothetical protein
VKRYHRRAVLGSLGLSAVALPFLRSLDSHAQTPAPKRLIVFATPNGTWMDNFWPGDQCNLGPILEPLQSMMSKILVLRGIDHKAAAKDPVPKDHWPDNYNMLIARQPVGGPDSFGPGGISIDQHIAKAIGAETKFASQHSGVQCGGYCNIISALGENEPVPPENNPYKVYERFFSDFNVDEDELARIRAEKKSILDTLGGELGDLRCRLGTADRDKLDVHLDSIREIEKQIDFQNGACTVPTIGAEMDLGDNDDFPAAGKLQMDMIAAGLACDLTRVVTLQWRHGNGDPLTYNWLDNVPYTQHDLAHNNVGVDVGTQSGMLTKIDRFYAEQFAYLIEKLDAIEEGGGTLLDNCAVLWAHEQSDGGSHKRNDHPYVLAGSCGGAFKTGQCIDFGGAANSGLLMALAHAMGVPTDDFGDPDFSDGPMSGLG